MGRAARTKHERREVARWAQAAELAQRADQAADHVIAHCLAQAFGRSGPLDLDALRSLRAQVAERTTWPSWSWLPNTIFVQNLLATNGIAIGQTNDAELEKYCRLAAAMTTVVNWLPGRTVAYYDVTLLESLAIILLGSWRKHLVSGEVLCAGRRSHRGRGPVAPLRPARRPCRWRVFALAGAIDLGHELTVHSPGRFEGLVRLPEIPFELHGVLS